MKLPPTSRLFLRAAGTGLIACLLGFAPPAVAQEEGSLPDSAGSPPFSLCSDARGAADAAGDLFTAPLRFSPGQWIATGAILGGTALLLTIDRPVRELALRNQSRTGGDLADAGNLYGSFPPWLIASGILYGGGALTRSERTRTTGLMLFESIAISGSITAVCKVLTGRSRPYVNEGAFRFRGVRFSDESLSLPSGHSTVAFAASSVLASRIGNPAAAAGLYLLAGLTAASRVYRDEHWISDTFLGAAIGTVVGNAVVRFGEREAAGAGLLIIPAPGGMRAELVF